MTTPLKAISFQHRDLKGHTLGTRTYEGVSFAYADGRYLKFEDAQLISCDMSFMSLIGATFRLSCKQGALNKLDDYNACLFLLWFMRMFNLTPQMESGLKSAMGSGYDKAKRAFESEPTL